MELWIPITIAAAFLQNVRSALQKSLKARLGDSGATATRFLYGAPFALLFVVGASAFEAPPGPTAAWSGWLVVGAVTQILATAALMRAFDAASFAAATAISKVEPVFVVVVAAALLGEAPTLWVALGAGLVAIGVMAAAAPASGLAPSRAALGLGLGAAGFFALSAVGFRAATGALEDGSVVIRAAMTLAAATLLQSAIMAAWMSARSPGGLAKTARAWRPGLMAGLAGAAASAGWFTALTLEPAAHVRALAQVELMFTVMVSWLVFREPQRPRALIGVALTAGGVALVLLGR